MDTNWEERKKYLSERSDEDQLFDIVGGAVYAYAQKKNEEAERWKNAYEFEKAKNEYFAQHCARYGIPVPDFSLGIPTPVPAEPKKKVKREKNFIDLIQDKDKTSLLTRLHNRIDGLGGKPVALVLLRAKADKLISKLPSKTEFCSEFKNISGDWRSISHFFSPNCNPAPDISSIII